MTKDSNQVLLSLIDALFNSKYSDVKFYCHNLGGYDIVFVLKVLLRFNQENPDNQYIVDVICRKDTVLKVTIKKTINGKVHSRSIADSYVLLPESLISLSDKFNV